jgi:hypothetical protein
VASQWYVSGTTLPVGTDAAIKAKIIKKFELKGTIGTTPVKLTATGLSCTACKITNAVVTSGTTPVAMGKGKIKFTGVTVDLPNENCTVRNETKTGEIGVIETKALEVHADFMNTANTVAYQQFFPESGSVFATIRLEGGECAAIAGSYNVTGTVFSKAINATGVNAVSQENEFSPAIQTEAGAVLSLGANPAELTGTGAFELESAAEYNAH